MARIPLIDPDDPTADPKAAALLKAAEGMGGTGRNIFRVLANHPDMLEAVLGLASVAYVGGRLTAKQAELAYLTSAVALECFY